MTNTKKSFDDYTGLAPNSQGGTEQMATRLMSSLTEEQKNDFQIICSRIRKFRDNKLRIFWAHDLWNDNEAFALREYENLKNLHHTVFVSNWQRTTYQVAHGTTYGNSSVIRNGIELFDTTELSNKYQKQFQASYKPRKLIYHTTPHRGLEILVPVFLELLKTYPDLTLDVYSSFGIYGWQERDAQYEHFFKICREHPSITYHGWQPNSVVRKALTEADIFAYPSIWTETSCIAAIEALCAGCRVVTNDLGALPETVQPFPSAIQYKYFEDHNAHATYFYHVMLQVLKQLDEKQAPMLEPNVLQRIAARYDFENTIKNEWQTLLRNIKDANAKT